jgi:hypothetical protein
VKRYAPDAFGLAQRKDIGASAALSFAASRLWITPKLSSAQMGGAVNPGVHVGGAVNPGATDEAWLNALNTQL